MTVEDEAQAPGNPSLDHLLARLAALEDRVRAAVALRRAVDPEPDDPFRGLYLSEQGVDHLLAGPRSAVAQATGDPAADLAVAAAEDSADAWVMTGEVLRLRQLASSFELDAVDVGLLLVAVAPDIDPRFERLYGYLHDDVTRRRASIGLALELSGLSTASVEARARLAPGGRLARHGLLELEDVERPVLTRALRVPDRITSYLLGGDRPDADLAEVLDAGSRSDHAWPLLALTWAVAHGSKLAYLHEARLSSGAATAAASVTAFGARPLILDLARLARSGRPRELVASAIREARLASMVLVAGPVDALLEGHVDLIRPLAAAGWPTILYGERAWDPAWSPANPLLLELPTPSAEERARVWLGVLSAGDATPLNGHADELLEATRAFRLTGPQVARAAEAGRLRASAAGRPLLPADLQAAARAQNASGLDRLAHRIEPAADWRDLVLPGDVRGQLRELTARARHRERVLDEWQLGGRSSRGRGITALFAGESGTGKTLAAEVIGAELGLDLYVIDLSTVVDKYIGETEKNLDRIFTAADRVNGILLFDEADAIFGKRSEVRDARDRYANVEVAYLLQRMERFDGLAILTTNLRANLDDAFTRRIDVIVDFPMPDEDARLRLWHMHLPEHLPKAPDLDLPFMARRFRMAGGNIRNICLTAAFLAADGDTPVSMAEIIRATEREYRKLGRLTLEDEFGPYYAVLQADTAANNRAAGTLPG
jgi:hypothetical protein